MTFIEIYNRIIPYWSDKIDFSDGIIFESEQESLKTCANSKEAFQSNLLTKQWDNVERIVGAEDNYGELMVWTMYQVFHKNATILFSQNVYTFKPSDIDKEELEEQYFENLNTESWEDELEKYQRVIK